MTPVWEVGGLINKTLYVTLLLGNHKSRFSHPPVRDLNVDIETVTGPSVVYHPEGLKHTLLSHGCISKNGSRCDNYGQKVLPKTGIRGKERDFLGQLVVQLAIISPSNLLQQDSRTGRTGTGLSLSPWAFSLFLCLLV